MPTLVPNGGRQLHIYNDKLVFEDPSDQCLIIHRKQLADDGMPKCAVVAHEQQSDDGIPVCSYGIEGIYGCYDLPAPVGPVLLVIKSSESVLKSHHMNYERVTEVRIFTFPHSKPPLPPYTCAGMHAQPLSISPPISR